MKDIINAINILYGDFHGAILTGSQSNKIELSSLSDIDIIIFSLKETVLYSYKAILEYKYDILVIPILNIDYILNNEFFDNRGVVLNMITSGKIIKDSQDLVIKNVQHIAKLRYSKLKQHAIYESQFVIRDLIRIKETSRIITGHLDWHLLTSELTVKSMQLFYLQKHGVMPQTIKHTIRTIKKDNNTHFEYLMELSRSIVKNKSMCKSVPGYVDNLISEYSLGFDDVPQWASERVLVDLHYEKINAYNFVNAIKPVILANSILGKRFLYFYYSNLFLNRVYRNSLTLVFNTQGIESALLCQTVNEIISKEADNVTTSMLPTFYYQRCLESSNLPFLLEPVYRSLSDLISQRYAKNQQVTVDEMIIFSCSIFGFIASRLDIRLKNLKLINRHLVNKWLHGFKEAGDPNDRITYQDELRNYKINSYRNFALQNRDRLSKTIKSGIQQSQNIKGAPSSSLFLTSLKEAIELPDLFQEIVKAYPLANNFNMQFNTSQHNELLIYQHMVESILFQIFENHESISQVVYIYNASIMLLHGELI